MVDSTLKRRLQLVTFENTREPFLTGLIQLIKATMGTLIIGICLYSLDHEKTKDFQRSKIKAKTYVLHENLFAKFFDAILIQSTIIY